MSAITAELHKAFLRPLDDRVLRHSDVKEKPLLVDLALPLPPRLRVYMYSLVVGGKHRRGEYKAVLRVPGQPVGEYDSFDHSGDRLAILVAYHDDLDVFVFWDASLHPQFKNGGNIQVKDATVLRAAATGHAEQVRSLSGGKRELVIACRSYNLAAAIDARVSRTGDTEDQWGRCPN